VIAERKGVWPQGVFDAPVLRRLDEVGRERIMAAGRLLDVAAGTTLDRQHDTGDSFFVVAAGAVKLSAQRRGAVAPTIVRVARMSETFGEEATLPGGTRRTTATVVEPALVAEIPTTMYRRAVGRAGAEIADQERRDLRRSATKDLLETMAFTAELSPVDIGLVLDAVRYETFERGDKIYGVGDLSTHFYMIVSGLVQLQTEDDEHVHVRAYLTTGDFFGDEELLWGMTREVAAVAMGDCHVMSMTAGALRTLADRNPGLLARVRRIATDRKASQVEVVGEEAAFTTKHVFKDLYRMQMARSLLTIDQEACVRCGHCAWSCASLYGVARLVRRGDKIVTRVGAQRHEKSLLVPNSCQHCKNPACMIDCPTGAIGREVGGEVFIREDLCTGCGNCSKACPWENIQMAPRPSGGTIAEALRQSLQTDRSATEVFPEVAVKCDLCRSYEAPACVQACPTEAIARLDPTQDFAAVARVLGTQARGGRGRVQGLGALLAVASTLSFTAGAMVLGPGLHARGVVTATSGLGYVFGWVSLAAMVLLMGYAVPKRIVRLWMRRRPRDALASLVDGSSQSTGKGARSRVRPFYVAHLALGIATPGAVAMHGGLAFSGSPAGAVHMAFWVTVVAGVVGGVAYRIVPRRLSRLERVGTLPEDLRYERDNLLDRLHRTLSGRTDLVKGITEKILVPYAHAPLGWLALLFSGRSLAGEEARLRQRIDTALQGRGAGKTAGLDDAIRVAIELRALPARRALDAWLRGWVPVHVVAAGTTLALLMVHVLGVSLS
jgi:Fe-S-cluster-containing dehydrogenase component/CRP-like cAMP-binding protein